jgi:hypothetical protein
MSRIYITQSRAQPNHPNGSQDIKQAHVFVSRIKKQSYKIKLMAEKAGAWDQSMALATVPVLHLEPVATFLPQ